MSASTDFLKFQMNRMRLNWRLTLDSDSKRAQDAEFKPLLDKWGEERFRGTIDECIRKHATGFFPSMAEFLAFDPGAIGPMNMKVCPTCRDTEGFTFIERADFAGRIRPVAIRCKHGRPA